MKQNAGDCVSVNGRGPPCAASITDHAEGVSSGNSPISLAKSRVPVSGLCSASG